jgi:A/G-specific adenine glycosylase
MPVTALDVNARRVIGRLLDGAPLPAAPSPETQARVDALAPSGDAADWNHALMDLGASVCRRVPDCPTCPVRRWCWYAAGGTRGAEPRPAERRPGTPFHASNRYVRGRVLAVLRDAPTGAWVRLDAGTMGLEHDRLARAVRELATEGFVELQVEAIDFAGVRLRES